MREWDGGVSGGSGVEALSRYHSEDIAEGSSEDAETRDAGEAG